jgi:hypothetical protein
MTPARDRRTTALVVGLAGWWVAMAAGNLPWVDPKQVRARERWGSLIPNWKFFTPNPISFDDYLHVRTVAADQTVGPWQDASPVPLREGRHAVWFPARRRDRALSNVLPNVGRAAAKRDIMAAAAELRLLDGMAGHFVRRQAPDAVAYQFSILRCRGEYGLRTRPYISSVRPLR